jgi:hypothetical protein
MTTGISILTDSIPNCLQIPLEAIQVDSVSYVYKQVRNGFQRQEVVTGSSNDSHIAVAAGLSAGDVISLNVPDGAEKFELQYLDADIRSAARETLAQELAARMKIQQEIARTIKPDDAQQDDNSGGVFIVF